MRVGLGGMNPSDGSMAVGNSEHGWGCQGVATVGLAPASTSERGVFSTATSRPSGLGLTNRNARVATSPGRAIQHTFGMVSQCGGGRWGASVRTGRAGIYSLVNNKKFKTSCKFFHYERLQSLVLD